MKLPSLSNFFIKWCPIWDTKTLPLESTATSSGVDKGLADAPPFILDETSSINKILAGRSEPKPGGGDLA